ncbi:MAG: hypothetical protein LPJ98_07340, partial [Cyclobacteriaceae bacterium]|nr:hypothetical protein [Cyclobacteriaceae bacterium]
MRQFSEMVPWPDGKMGRVEKLQQKKCKIEKGLYASCKPELVLDTIMIKVDEKGFYGKFGGAYIPEMLHPNIEEL